MKNHKKIFVLLLCGVLSLAAHAQGSHWTVDAYNYQYDMTVYYTLTENGQPLTAWDGYEVAAFVDDECRGVGTVRTDGGTTYGYLRVRSNQPQGERISFRVYVKDTGRETDLTGVTLTFVSQGAMGLPSAPVTLNLATFLPGDANNDGSVSSADLVALAKHILNEGETPVANTEAADMNGDGKLSSADLVAIARFILNR